MSRGSTLASTYKEGERCFAYAHDEIACEQETALTSQLIEGQKWEDPDFPPDDRSIYLVPSRSHQVLNPTGSIRWQRPDSNETIISLLVHKTIYKGNLGNSVMHYLYVYFVNALALLTKRSEYISRVVVSTKNADKGIYTFKFAKDGRFVYVHIDDLLPHRLHGQLVFCQCENILPCLLEKAYAKLHGVYELLTHGLIEQVITDFSPSISFKSLRFEVDFVADPFSACDGVWDYLENIMSANNSDHDKRVDVSSLVGCMRTLPPVYRETVLSRRGIDADCMYQILDIAVVEAAATAEYDAITVGLLCLRTIQAEETGAGIFQGRWQHGHTLWEQYPFIKDSIRSRTNSLMRSQLAEGVSHHANEMCDVFWIQIEDFVECFNRVYMVKDVQIDSHRYTLHEYSDLRIPPLQSDDLDVTTLTTTLLQDNHSLSTFIPFRIVEASRCVFHMHQMDRRFQGWKSSDDEDLSDTSTYFWVDKLPHPSTLRDDILTYPFRYNYALGMLVYKLQENNVEGTYEMDQLCAYTDQIVYTHRCSLDSMFVPGVYVIMPFLLKRREDTTTNTTTTATTTIDPVKVNVTLCVDVLNVELAVQISEVSHKDIKKEPHSPITCSPYHGWEWRESSVDDKIKSLEGIYDDIKHILQRPQQQQVSNHNDRKL